MLRASNIIVRYGLCEVINDISFDLAAGEILALLGPNGAGKTTLIKALNGSIPLHSGQVMLGNLSLDTMSRCEVAKRIAVVAQENETKFPVTVLDFVVSGRFASGSAFGWETDADLLAADGSLTVAELKGFESRLMNELSGGERQRVVFARALATGAKVLLLDEPAANLDLAHQASMFKLVRRKCSEDGYSAIVITHDLNLAAEFASRVILLSKGSIHAIGKASEVMLANNLKEVFNVDVLLDRNPASGNVRVTAVY